MTTVTVTEQVATVTVTQTGATITIAPVTVGVTVAPGVTSFLGLSDTPDAYATHGGQAVAVKSDVSGLEFVAFPSSTPTGSAGGVLSGTYPNPGFASDMATQSELDAAIAALSSVYARLGATNTFTKANLFSADADGTIPLAARRHSSGATGNLQEWQDENGDAFAWINKRGRLAFGANASPEGSTRQGYISLGRDVTELPPSAGGVALYAVDVELNIDLPSNTHPSSIIAANNFFIETSSTALPSQIVGAYGEVDHNSSGSVAEIDGVAMFAYVFGDGHVDALRGVVVDAAGYSSGVGSIGEAAAVYINADFSDTPTTTKYGVFIGDQSNSVAASIYAMYTNGGPVHFGDYLELPEITAPSAASANSGRLFVRDNGGGKSQLAIRFPSGAIQVIATEP